MILILLSILILITRLCGMGEEELVPLAVTQAMVDSHIPQVGKVFFISVILLFQYNSSSTLSSIEMENTKAPAGKFSADKIVFHLSLQDSSSMITLVGEMFRER